MESVRRLRNERGLSQRRLAAEAGIDQVTLVHIETGKTSPKVETLEKLAKALGVQVGEFFPLAQPPLPFGPQHVKGPDEDEWGLDSERPSSEPPRPGGQAHRRNLRDSVEVRDAVTTQIETIVRALDRREITADEAVAKLQELMAA
jgi:transcriptional regulator with XRE-family HTH domain